MKAIYSTVTHVKKVPSRAVTCVIIEVPIEFHKEVTALFDDEHVLVTLAKLDQPYGVIESEQEDKKEQTISTHLTAEQMNHDSVTIPAPSAEDNECDLRKEKPTVKECLDLDGEPYSVPIPKEMENIQTGAITHISDTGKVVTTFKKEKPLSCQAHFMVQEPSFWGFINSRIKCTIDGSNADEWLKGNICIKSKKELDDPTNEDSIRYFKGVQKEWRQWVNR